MHIEDQEQTGNAEDLTDDSAGDNKETGDPRSPDIPNAGVGEGGEDEGKAAPPPERPDHIPEKFWNAETGEVATDKLAKSYAELEKLRGKSIDDLKAEFKAEWETERTAGRPEAPDKYELPQSELLDPDALAASPIVAVWREAAHEAGLGQEQFAGVLEKYAAAEMERGKAHYEAQMEALGENAKDRANAVGAWASKVFGEGEHFDAVARIASDKAGVEAIEKLIKLTADINIEDNSDPAGTNREDTLEDIQKLQQSKEYWSAAHRDPKVVERVEAFFKKQAGQ